MRWINMDFTPRGRHGSGHWSFLFGYHTLAPEDSSHTSGFLDSDDMRLGGVGMRPDSRNE